MRYLVILIMTLVVTSCSYHKVTRVEGKNLKYGLFIKGDEVKIHREVSFDSKKEKGTVRPVD